MKFCRFKIKDAVKFGVLEDQKIFLYENASVTDQSFELEEVELLPPVVPSKIVCIGRNYAAHAAELGNELPKEPLIFLKAPSAIVRDGDPIILPAQSEQVEHEGELAAVIGRKCQKLSDSDNPMNFVAGYVCLNDVTARDLQKRDVQFTRAKSFDTFCPISSFIESELEVSDLSVEVSVNGEVRQSGRTSQMVFPTQYLIKYVSNQMTLFPGDLIATGTPSGVSVLHENDLCEVSIEGIGKLSNPVVRL